jgi:hypothetical protein
MQVDVAIQDSDQVDRGLGRSRVQHPVEYRYAQGDSSVFAPAIAIKHRGNQQ